MAHAGKCRKKAIDVTCILNDSSRIGLTSKLVPSQSKKPESTKLAKAKQMVTKQSSLHEHEKVNI